jgi:hypothetical protein
MATIETGKTSMMRAIIADQPNAEVGACRRSELQRGFVRPVATMLDGGHAERFSMCGRQRQLPDLLGHTQEEIRLTLEKSCRSRYQRRSRICSEGVTAAAADNGAARADEKITNDMWPWVPVVPTMAAGASDGRFLTPNGIPTYGVSGLFGDPATTNAHGLNERMGVQSLYEGREFLDRLIKVYAAGQ